MSREPLDGTLENKLMKVGEKPYYFELKEGKNGRYIIITETIPDGRKFRLYVQLRFAEVYIKKLKVIEEFNKENPEEEIIDEKEDDDLQKPTSLKYEVLSVALQRYYFELKEIKGKSRLLRLSQLSRGNRSFIQIHAVAIEKLIEILSGFQSSFPVEQESANENVRTFQKGGAMYRPTFSRFQRGGGRYGNSFGNNFRGRYGYGGQPFQSRMNNRFNSGRNYSFGGYRDGRFSYSEGNNMTYNRRYFSNAPRFNNASRRFIPKTQGDENVSATVADANKTTSQSTLSYGRKPLEILNDPVPLTLESDKKSFKFEIIKGDNTFLRITEFFGQASKGIVHVPVSSCKTFSQCLVEIVSKIPQHIILTQDMSANEQTNTANAAKKKH